MYTKKTHNPNSQFFDKDELYNEYITNHNEKIDSSLVNYDSKQKFDKEFSLHIKSELQINRTDFHLKRFLLLWIDLFGGKGYKFSHISGKCVTTVSAFKNMTNEFYVKRPMQIVEVLLNLRFDENPFFSKCTS